MTSSLGTALTPLIGRDRELRALESRLASGARLITLTGPGGSGKTTLAREVFGRRLGQGIEAHFVDLVGISDPGLVPTEIATELGVTETADLDAAGAVVVALRESSATLALDNLEELVGARDFLAGLLQAAPGLQLIATSRLPLGISGEVEFQVPPLELPQGDEPSAVEASSAGALFLERARAVGRLDEVDAPTAKAIAQLCRRLDGLPLALELAAARTRIMPPGSILRHLAQHSSGALAKAGESDIRHKSLDAVLAWSLDLLETNEARVLGAIAICPGGFDLAMAEALAPDLNVLQAIEVLATHGLLLQRGEVEGEPWYQLLETIRAAAIERASDVAVTDGWTRLARLVSGRVSATLHAFYESNEAEFRRLDRMLANIRAALDWTEVNNPALNLSMVSQFWSYWRARGGSREAVSRLRVAIAANPVPSSELAQALVALAIMERSNGNMSKAQGAAAEAVEIARMVGDRGREIDGLAELISIVDEPMPEVSHRLRELLPTVKDPRLRYVCLLSLAVAGSLESGYSEAVVRQFRDARDAASGTSYRRLEGLAEANLAEAYLYCDRPRDAYECSARALSLLREGGQDVLSWTHSLHATAAAIEGQSDEAVSSLRFAFELATSGGEVLTVAMLAAVAILTQSGAPLLAAKAWGATAAGEFPDSPTNRPRDNLVTRPRDRAFAERLLVAARRASDPVAFEVAFRDGQRAGVAQVRDEVLAHLDAIAAFEGSDVGPVRLVHGILTQREIEVLGMVGAGKSDREIAAELFISPKTASVHVSNAKAKLGVQTRLEAALWARERGLVESAPHDA